MTLYMDCWLPFPLQIIQTIENVESQLPIPEKPIPRRTMIKDFQDPFQYFSDLKFEKCFRLPKHIVLDMVDILYPDHVEDLETRGGRVPNYLRVLIAMKYYATGSFQLVIGDLPFISQGTISKMVTQVSQKLTEYLPKYIKMDTNKLEIYKKDFLAIAGVPNVIGCIDCTHVNILSPGGQEAKKFRNENGGYSLKVQVVCNTNMVFTDLEVQRPGSTHDSTVFYNSNLFNNFEDNLYGNSHILGDTEFPCNSYLLTPFANPTTLKQFRYNDSHSKTRSIITKSIESWKRRFPCLKRTLQTKLTNSLSLISAVGVLHNFAMRLGLKDVEDDILCKKEDAEGELNLLGFDIDNVKRNRIVEEYF